jgi:myo-inositol 2-dehydrogenase / D-chiro-inositol 1-dehydrogenase
MNDTSLNRRQFLMQAAAAGTALGAAGLVKSGAAPQRKLRAGLVGCGGRGSWIASHFKAHGGYEFIATADYFQDKAGRTGAALGVEESRCFSGLSGYRRVIDSGVEAIILQAPPCFYPEHAEAAVAAGLHVYVAKPVACDVPGTIRIGECGRQSTRNKRVFLVDYQMPTEPFNIEVRRLLREGGLGRLQMVFSVGMSGGAGFSDPPPASTIENRLQGLSWVNDDALGCGYIGNYDIHVIDAIIWALGRRPALAYGKGGRYRKDPQGDSFDTNFITYSFEDGLVWNHHSAVGPTHEWLKLGSLEGSIQGEQGAARLSYWGRAYVRGGPMHYGGGEIKDLYDQGARRNIAAFYDSVLAGNFANQTVERSVDCTLACILGREAARRGGLLSMDELIRENRTLAVDLRGLRV